jgi:hypothetical protein
MGIFGSSKGGSGDKPRDGDSRDSGPADPGPQDRASRGSNASDAQHHSLPPAPPGGSDRVLQPLTNELITHALNAMELKYFTDSDGDVGATWDDFIVYFFRMGEQEEILNIRVIIHRKFPVEDVLRLQTFCNDWNRDKLWPKAYVRVAEQDGQPVEAQVIGEVVTDLEYGVALAQVRQLISCAVGTGSSLGTALQELESL